MYDWDYSVTSCFPDYYRWTQWLFLQFYKHGLAYQKESSVNWCTGCKTVIANEQLVDGKCERCDSEAERKMMKQWFLKITDFAEELLEGLNRIDWPAKTKTMQRNWIGKSEGARVTWQIPNTKTSIETFTTRVDTVFGATFIVIAPEHPMVETFTTPEQKKAVDAYVKTALKKSDVERMEDHSKTGVFTGGYVINPATEEKIPVWVADYVIYTYGTGAVQGCPAHDERDFEFAKKYSLEIRQVLTPKSGPAPELPSATGHDNLDQWVLINSGQFNKITAESALTKITEWLQKRHLATPCTTYRLRDWSIGRQRYWGAPFPIVYCDVCGVVPVPENQLPVELPYLKDFKPKGAAPLASSPDFVNTTCPTCGTPAKREVDTMDTFMCSSWYFLRFPSAQNDKVPFDKDITNKILPIDKYVGGAEHSCGHLLQARFITKFLNKHGYINFDEPVKSLVHQGTILGPGGVKMSKSKPETVVTPDPYFAEFGSDILRLYMMFGFSYSDGGPWDDKTLRTTSRFIEKVERLVRGISTDKETDQNVLHVRANTIKCVREDLDNLSFNTAVARCMELCNAIGKSAKIAKESVRDLVLILAPMLPHISEELWEMLGNKPSIFDQPYPVADTKYLVRATVEIAVQLNSKIVGRITVSQNSTPEQVEAECKSLIGGVKAKKVVYVPGRLINFIA